MATAPVNERTMRRHTHKPNGHAGEDMERCPWCNSPINRVAFAAIQKRIAEQERARVAQEKARIEAEAKAAIERARKEAARAADQQIKAARASLDAAIAERMEAQREALDRAAAKAIADEKGRAYQERLRLEAKVRELARQLEARHPVALGDEGEVDLFDALRREFPGDVVERVSRGKRGADIIHQVVNANGVVAGRLVYNSKNVGRFSSRYIGKLRSDMHDAQADIGILSINSLPGGIRHFTVVNSIIVAEPARVPALVSLLRRHIIALHVMKLGNQDRVAKTTALLRFVASPTGRDKLQRVVSLTSDMDDLGERETRSQQQVKRERIEINGAMREAVVEYLETIDGIIETAPGGVR